MNDWHNDFIEGNTCYNSYLSHSWGKNPKQKKREKEYNHWYYEQHKKLKGTISKGVNKVKESVGRIYEVADNTYYKDPTDNNSILDFIGFGLIGGKLLQDKREKIRLSYEQAEKQLKQDRIEEEAKRERYEQYLAKREENRRIRDEAHNKEVQDDLRNHNAYARMKSNNGKYVYFSNKDEYTLAEEEYKNSGQDAAKTKELIDAYGLAKKEDTTIDACQEIINPNFDPYNPLASTDNNCIYCAEAYELRRRGYDVQAREITSTDNILTISQNDIMSGEETRDFVYDPNTEGYGADGSYRDEMTKLIEQYGNKSRGIFTFYYSFNGQSYGHAINWEVVDGDVKFIDTQQPSLKPYDSLDELFKEYDQYGVRIDSMQAVRLDNKSVGDITDHVKKRGTNG